MTERRSARVAATGAQVVQVAGDAAAAAATLNRSATVEYAEPNVELHALGDAQRRALRPALRAQQRQRRRHGRARGLGPRRARRLPGDGGVKVGIVDTGIDSDHEDLAGKTVDCASVQLLTNNVREGTCTDQNDHGTHVAGTIAAKANNGVGVAGVSFNSQPGDLQGAQRAPARARPRASPTASPTWPARA